MQSSKHVAPLDASRVCQEGLELARSGQLSSAIERFTRAMDNEACLPEVFRYRGLAYFKLGRYGEALADQNQAVVKNPTCAGCFFERGATKMMLRDMEAALTDLCRCVTLDSNFPPAYSMGAAIYNQMQDFPSALEYITRALALSPDNPDYLHNKAVILTGMGQYREAAAHYEQALNLRPDSPGTLNNLAWLLCTAPGDDFRDGARAVGLAQQALEGGMNPPWLDTLAAALAEAGRFDEAMDAAEEAYRRSTGPNENYLIRLNLYRRGHTYARYLAERRESNG